MTVKGNIKPIDIMLALEKKILNQDLMETHASTTFLQEYDFHWRRYPMISLIEASAYQVIPR